MIPLSSAGSPVARRAPPASARADPQVFVSLSVEPNKIDLTTRWPAWTRSWDVRLLCMSAALILITWLALAVWACLSNRDRIIGADFPN